MICEQKQQKMDHIGSLGRVKKGLRRINLMPTYPDHANFSRISCKFESPLFAFVVVTCEAKIRFKMKWWSITRTFDLIQLGGCVARGVDNNWLISTAAADAAFTFFWGLSIMERDPLPYCGEVEEYWLTKDHRMFRTLSLWKSPFNVAIWLFEAIFGTINGFPWLLQNVLSLYVKIGNFSLKLVYSD